MKIWHIKLDMCLISSTYKNRFQYLCYVFMYFSLNCPIIRPSYLHYFFFLCESISFCELFQISSILKERWLIPTCSTTSTESNQIVAIHFSVSNYKNTAHQFRKVLSSWWNNACSQEINNYCTLIGKILFDGQKFVLKETGEI